MPKFVTLIGTLTGVLFLTIIAWNGFQEGAQQISTRPTAVLQLPAEESESQFGQSRVSGELTSVCGEVNSLEDGDPIASAVVSRRSMSDDTVGSLETDQLGRFCLAVNLSNFEADFIAIADGYELGGATWRRQNNRPVRISLAKNAGLRLIVRDSATQLPVDTVSVVATNRSKRVDAQSELENHRLDSRKTVSGLITLPRLAPGFWELSVMSRGYSRTSLIIDLRTIDDSVPQPVSLYRIAVLSGIVFDKAMGLPIAGARVGFSSNPKPDPYGRPMADLYANTSQDGAFTFEDVKLGLARLYVMADGFATLDREIDTKSQPFVELGLRPETNIVGVLYRADGTTPAQGAITLLNKTNGASTKLQSDEQGNFKFRAIRPGEYSVVAASLYGVSDECDVSVSLTDRMIRCRLIAQSVGSTLYVELINSQPALLNGAALEVWIQDRLVRTAQLPKSKHFVVSGLESGTGFLKFVFSDGSTYRQLISIDSQSDGYVFVDLDAR